MFRRQHLLVCFTVILVTSALVAGCAEDEQATPRVTFDSKIFPGKHSQAECASSFAPWFTIGSFGNPGLGRTNPEDPESPPVDPVKPVDDGAEDQQGTAVVSCSVVEAGDGFDVALHAELSGATGGAMTLTGHILRAVDSPNISLALTRRGETYSGAGNCNVTFTPSVGHGIAGGRVWAVIECPDAEAPSQQRICTTQAEFRFENCTQ